MQGLQKRTVTVHGGVVALPSRVTFARSRRTQFSASENESGIVLVADDKATPSFGEVRERLKCHTRWAVLNPSAFLSGAAKGQRSRVPWWSSRICSRNHPR
eukprot:scaffold4057_cov390-Prasinococcus_capsulatus_cf.AAC.2